MISSQTAYWVAEAGSPTESQGTLDEVSLTPKTVGCYAQVTRRLLEEAKATPDVVALIVDDMARHITAVIQDKAHSGDGTSNTPTGLYNSTIGSVSFATGNDPTWAETVEVWETVASNSCAVPPEG